MNSNSTLATLANNDPVIKKSIFGFIIHFLHNLPATYNEKYNIIQPVVSLFLFVIIKDAAKNSQYTGLRKNKCWLRLSVESLVVYGLCKTFFFSE